MRKILQTWIKEHDIEERTLQYAKEMLNGFQVQEPEEYVKVFGKLDLSKIKYVIFRAGFDFYYETDYQWVSLEVHYIYEGSLVARYVVEYGMNGEIVDDSFIT